MFGAGRLMLSVTAQMQQAAVHLRMQRLHAAIHHLWETRVIAHILHLQPRLAHHTGRAAGAEDFHPSRRQSLSKGHKPVLVRNRNECALNLSHETREIWPVIPSRSTAIHWQVIPRDVYASVEQNSSESKPNSHFLVCTHACPADTHLFFGRGSAVISTHPKATKSAQEKIGETSFQLANL